MVFTAGSWTLGKEKLRFSKKLATSTPVSWLLGCFGIMAFLLMLPPLGAPMCCVAVKHRAKGICWVLGGRGDEDTWSSVGILATGAAYFVKKKLTPEYSEDVPSKTDSQCSHNLFRFSGVPQLDPCNWLSHVRKCVCLLG